MKRSLLVLAVVMVGSAACGGGGGSGRGPGLPAPSLVTPTMLQPPPIYALLGYRDRLDLTSEQIISLDSIAVALKDENDVLIDSLTNTSMRARNQPALIVDEEGKPLLDEIRNNNREASESVGKLLTSTQQSTTCDIFRPGNGRNGRNGRAPQRRPPVRGADRAAADSIWRSLESRIWPWCGGDGPETAARGDSVR